MEYISGPVPPRRNRRRRLHQEQQPRESVRSRLNQLLDGEDADEVIDLSVSPVAASANHWDDEYEIDDSSDDDMHGIGRQIGLAAASHPIQSSHSIGHNSSSGGGSGLINSPADSRYEFDAAIAESNRMEGVDDDEEEQVKRACLDTMPSSSQDANTTTTDDSVMCTICFEAWTSDGPHRVMSLKCGHVYGLSCIEKWMITTKKCPACQQPIKKTDIRFLFVRSLKALDTSERETLKKEIAQKEEENQRLSLRIASSNMDLDNTVQKLIFCEGEIERLKRELLQRQTRPGSHLPGIRSANHTAIRSGGCGASGSHQQHEAHKSYTNRVAIQTAAFQMVQKPVEVCSYGGCRVMASCRDMDTIAISLQNPNRLFPEHGVRRINPFDFSLSDFIHIHSGEISDMCFKPDDPLLLSVSADKTMKLTSLIDKSVVNTFNLGEWGRSCCWHPTENFSCFVGLNSGAIQRYDIRYPSAPTHSFEGIVNTPLISIQFVGRGDGSQNEEISGLMCSSLNSCCFYEISGNGDMMSQQSLQLEGLFLPSHYDNESGYGLISTRPSAREPRLLHHVIQLKKSFNSVTSEVVHKFPGGGKSEKMSKSKLYANPSTFDQKPYVFAVDEQNYGIMLYDTTTGKVSQMIKTNDMVMDIALVSSSSEIMRIAALTAKGITFFDKKFAY